MNNKDEFDKWYDALPGWKVVVLFFTLFPFLLGLRGLWQATPNIWTCALFWICAFADEPIRWRLLHGRRLLLYRAGLFGSALNALATLANGGFMPVEGKTDFTSLWAPMTADCKLYWLCDVFGGASIGDFFILTCLAGFFINWTLEKLGAIELESGRVTKFPSLGVG